MPLYSTSVCSSSFPPMWFPHMFVIWFWPLPVHDCEFAFCIRLHWNDLVLPTLCVCKLGPNTYFFMFLAHTPHNFKILRWTVFNHPTIIDHWYAGWQRGWSLSHLTLGERLGTPWTGHQFITRLAYRDDHKSIWQYRVTNSPNFHVFWPSCCEAKVLITAPPYHPHFILNKYGFVDLLNSFSTLITIQTTCVSISLLNFLPFHLELRHVKNIFFG